MGKSELYQAFVKEIKEKGEYIQDRSVFNAILGMVTDIVVDGKDYYEANTERASKAGIPREKLRDMVEKYDFWKSEKGDVK